MARARKAFSIGCVAAVLSAGCSGGDGASEGGGGLEPPAGFAGVGAAGSGGTFGNSPGGTAGTTGTGAGLDPVTGGNVAGGSGGTGAAGTPPTEPPPPPLPDEMEQALEFGLPQASESYVYAVNPEGGTVAIIHAESLAIEVLEAGVRPTHLKTLAGTDDAVVLNVGSDDATIIRHATSGGWTTSSVPVVAGSNELAVSPDGGHAVAWFDASQPGTTIDSGSFQSVSVIFLEAGADRVVDMTVGFRPRAVFFAGDGTRAFVVTEDGVSELDFADIDAGGSAIAPRISLGANLDQESADVAVTPSGRWALARDLDASEVRLVDLRDGTVKRLDLATIPGIGGGSATVEVTDLDLAPSGEFALAVVRNQRSVVRVDIPRGFNDPDGILVATIPGEILGSATIAPTSDRALVYTTASDEERITILDLVAGGSSRTVALRKTIEAVAISPDGETALVVHVKKPGNPDEGGITPDAAIDRSYGYSVLGLASGQVKLQVTETPPGSFTLVPGYLFMLFRSDGLGVREVHQVSTTSFLVTPYGLGSPPISVGAVVSAHRIFVNQEHADGRITLIDWTNGKAQTVTGYELNSTIRD